MGYISIEHVQPGMVLANDLFADQGQFVLAKGIEITREHLRAFHRWNIREMDIDGIDFDDIDNLEPCDPVLVQACQEYIDQRFRLIHINPGVLETIYNYAQKLHLRRCRTGLIPSSPQPEMSAIVVPDPLPKKPSSDQVIKGQVDLASLPKVYQRILDALAEPNCSAGHLAGIISKDTSVSLRLLKLVNSAYYALPSKVDSVSRAIALLGTRELMSLVQGISIVQTFKKIPGQMMDMESFWKHSIRTALYAQKLARRCGVVSDEQFFTGGLLHDIGRMVMMLVMPEWYSVTIQNSLNEQQSLTQAERHTLVYDHAMIGRMLCEKWRLSHSLAQMIGWHHKPQSNHYALETSILHVADFLAQALGDEVNVGQILHPLDEKAWEKTGLTPSDIEPLAHQVEREFGVIVKTFLLEDDADLCKAAG